MRGRCRTVLAATALLCSGCAATSAPLSATSSSATSQAATSQSAAPAAVAAASGPASASTTRPSATEAPDAGTPAGESPTGPFTLPDKVVPPGLSAPSETPWVSEPAASLVTSVPAEAPCGSDDLTATMYGSSGPVMGTATAEIVLHDRSGRDCLLSGWPVLVALTPSGAADELRLVRQPPGVVAKGNGPEVVVPGPGTLLMRPGTAASVWLSFSTRPPDKISCGGTEDSGLLVGMGTATRWAVTGFRGYPGCRGGEVMYTPFLAGAVHRAATPLTRAIGAAG